MYFFAVNKLIVMVDVYILLITKNGEVTKKVTSTAMCLCERSECQGRDYKKNTKLQYLFFIQVD